MESMHLNEMQVIVLNQSGLQNEQLTYRYIKPRLAKQLIGLGVLHVLIGVFCIISQSISLGLYLNQSKTILSTTLIGNGFWNGLLFSVNGIIGIAAGIRKQNCQVVAFNILSIISAATVWVMIIMAALYAYSVSLWCETPGPRNCSFATNAEMATMLVIESMLAALGILEAIFAIWSSIVCCLIGVCGCRHASPPQMQSVILSGEQQAALMSNPMFLPNQQQPVVDFYSQQQTVEYNKQQSKFNAPPDARKIFMSAAAVEGPYTSLTTGMRCSLPPSDVESPTYEELRDYDYEI